MPGGPVLFSYVVCVCVHVYVCVCVCVHMMMVLGVIMMMMMTTTTIANFYKANNKKPMPNASGRKQER